LPNGFGLPNQHAGETVSELEREDDRQLTIMVENVRLSPEQARASWNSARRTNHHDT
jgi:hypothetical protein